MSPILTFAFCQHCEKNSDEILTLLSRGNAATLDNETGPTSEVALAPFHFLLVKVVICVLRRPHLTLFDQEYLIPIKTTYLTYIPYTYPYPYLAQENVIPVTA